MKNQTDLIVEFCSDITEEVVFACVHVSWTYENDTWELPGSFSWEYLISNYVDPEGNIVNRPNWLNDAELEKEIQREFDFLDLEN